MTDYTFSSIVSASPGTSRSGSVVNSPPRASTAPVRVPIRGRYDAAQSNSENAKLWGPADDLSARAANEQNVRYRLRNRARYEVANNSYAKGVVLTLANEVMGTGPRLQLMTDSPDLNQMAASAFDEWAAETRLAEKLRTVMSSRVTDGEVFGVMASNPRLKRTPIQLDLQLLEADQVADPVLGQTDPRNVDGVIFDDFGNPVAYHVFEDHPGDRLQFSMNRSRLVPAEQVIHWFRMDRPGQARGVPEITPALYLFGLLRRYTLAVLAAAETAADFAAVLYSELPPDGEPIESDPFETLQIERRMMTTLPAGWKMGQFKAEQPTTTYAMFKAELLNEIFRCLLMPYNVGAGNSSGYNYASGRLDHQTFYKAIKVVQYDAETAILDRVLSRWVWEAAMTGVLPREFATSDPWHNPVPHQWFWDGSEHVDPLKEASAQERRLTNGTTTLADEWARQGYDWREKARQTRDERAYYAELGIPYPGDTPANTTNQGGGDAAEPDPASDEN